MDHRFPVSELQPSVTVIIPTVGRQTLSTCLASVLLQTLPRHAYEVIVVDDDSSSEYDLLPADVQLYRLGQAEGPAAARNQGVALSRAPIVAFTDDDCTVPINWLEALLAGFSEHPTVDIVGGYLRPIDEALAASAVARLELYGVRDRGGLSGQSLTPANESPAWGTNNLAWRTDTFRRLGGFDPRLRVGEDSELARRAGAAGVQALFLPLAVHHHRDYTWLGLWRQYIARGKDQSLSRGRRDVLRAIARLPIAVGRALARVRTGDIGVVAASLLADIAFSYGQVALPPSCLSNYRTAEMKHRSLAVSRALIRQR
jgi:glycosyltransferase involved in cell wall biosynthesis